MKGETDEEEHREGDRSRRSRLTDGEAFAEVVEPHPRSDPQGDGMGFRPGTNDVVIEPRDPDEPQNEAEYERRGRPTAWAPPRADRPRSPPRPVKGRRVKSR